MPRTQQPPIDQQFPEIKDCPDPLPCDLQVAADALAQTWITSEHRPRVSPNIAESWSILVDDWIASESLPLYVRRHRRNRGSIITHQSGRELVPCDNSVAHWIYALALGGICPPLDKIAEFIKSDRIPIAMAFNSAEKQNATYTCGKQPVSLNKLGWKICHIDSVGFRSRIDLATCPFDSIVSHFRKYVSPANMFLVPKTWAGLGELPAMIQAAQQDMA